MLTDSARQSPIEGGEATGLSEEHHCQKARATRKIDFAKPQQAECHLFTSPVNKRFGLKIGNLLHLDTYFDEQIALQPRSAFNCGLLTESITMQSKDLIALIDPKISRFAK